MSKTLWIFNHYAGLPETVPATRTFEISRLLAARGWQVTVIAAGFNHYTFKEDWTYARQGYLETKRDGVRWCFLRTFPYTRNGLRRALNIVSYRLGALRWAGRQTLQPDAIVGTTVHPLAADAARVIAKRRHVPLFYEITDLWPETLVDLGVLRRGSLPYRYLFGLEKKAFRSARGVISVLPHVEAYASEFHQIELRDFCYAPNGIRPEDMRPSATAPVRCGRIVYLGGFARAHGLDSVLEAAAILARRAPAEYEFDLYGDGPERARLEARASSLGLTNVYFRGWVPKADVPQALASAEICLCTGRFMSVHRFGISFNKLFDYLAAGKPVVFAVDTVNDIVGAAGAGVSVPAGDVAALADGLARIHGMSAEAREEMGRRGRDLVLREFAFDVITDRVARFIDRAT